jgi:hypothetical protein
MEIFGCPGISKCFYAGQALKDGLSVCDMAGARVSPILFFP